MNHRIKDNRYKPLADWAKEKFGAEIRPDQIRRNDKPDCMEIWKVFFGAYFEDHPEEHERFSSFS